MKWTILTAASAKLTNYSALKTHQQTHIPANIIMSLAVKSNAEEFLVINFTLFLSLDRKTLPIILHCTQKKIALTTLVPWTVRLNVEGDFHHNVLSHVEVCFWYPSRKAWQEKEYKNADLNTGISWQQEQENSPSRIAPPLIFVNSTLSQKPHLSEHTDSCWD